MPVPQRSTTAPNQLTHQGAMRLISLAENFSYNHPWDPEDNSRLPIAVCVTGAQSHASPIASLRMDGTQPSDYFAVLMRCSMALSARCDTIQLPPITGDAPDDDSEDSAPKQFNPHSGGVLLRNSTGDLLGAIGVAGLVTPQANHHLAFFTALHLGYRSGSCQCGGKHDSEIFV